VAHVDSDLLQAMLRFAPTAIPATLTADPDTRRRRVVSLGDLDVAVAVHTDRFGLVKKGNRSAGSAWSAARSNLDKLLMDLLGASCV